jgi:hypothetical protein
MKAAVVSGLFVTASASLDASAPAISSRVASKINEMQKTWTAELPVRFMNATIGDVKRQLGTILPSHDGYLEPSEVKTVFSSTGAIPTEFDVRTNWPQCSAVTGLVRDQSNCGSCW